MKAKPTETKEVPSNPQSQSFTRRDFLKRSAGAAAATVVGSRFLGLVTQTAQGGELPARKNILLLITDQERPVMWFPPGWEAANLPTLTRLKNNGLTFNQAFCCTAMCSPSRNSIFTGLFPVQHGSTDTLTTYTPQDLIEHQLDPTLPNLATCLKEAGYRVYYKGKWHMSTEVTGADGSTIWDDISRYGFDQWDPPDAGGDTAPENFGGGTANHDQRFVNDAVAFLQKQVANPSSQPFCLVVSLVNPHDVLGYPGSYTSGGYDSSWLAPTTPNIALPPTITENLVTNKKPTAQAQVLAAMALSLGPLVTPQQQANYLNFYANLMKHVDGQLGQLLAVFDNGGSAGQQMLNDTLIIRMSDHGEMGLCHAGLRQKTFVAYEETVRVPLVWSNPQLFPTARTTDAMVSHVDFLPTLCALTGVPNWQAKGFKGVDYSSIILNPNASPVQSYVLFTFDDIYAGQNRANSPNGVASPPNRIQMIRTADYKYVRYYDASGQAADQEEFYDLTSGGGDYDATYQQPKELNNLSSWAVNNFPNPPTLTTDQQIALEELQSDLENAVADRLQPLPAGAPVGPKNLQIQVVRWTDDNGDHTQVQITFVSHSTETYQLQQSTDLLTWSDLDQPIPGNNGLVLRSYDLPGPQAYYRIRWHANGTT